MPYLTITIVDDFEWFRDFVCELLQERNDIRVVSQAADGLEAVRQAEELRPDLVLLDIGLPKLNGFEAARRIRTGAANPRILFVSQESQPEIVEASLQLGEGYVHKVDIANELLPAIETVMAAKQYLSASVRHVRVLP
jgi:DNA-binding NarL/FixJ family response regulator